MEEYKDKKVRIAYSGGSDSDTVMWLSRQLGYNITAVFYDTGLEYDATWKHVDYMKSEGFSIEIIKAKRAIPTSIKKYGYPFINKRVSDYLSRLQHHSFDFINDGKKSFEELSLKYTNCKTALMWWCNGYDYNMTNIIHNKYLKEFLIENGLPFSVSDKCCDGAKKLTIKEYAKKNNIDLMILGIRRAEKGSRIIVYKNCYLPAKTFSYAIYFPLFWWSHEDKNFFDKEVNIKHSECYEKYGMKRTGCAGCPFNKEFENDINTIEKYEPKLYRGINSIFRDSYNWTRKYKKFVKENRLIK
jgi:3'-phosphoadenosine 5'-phosphosulfate sulfotransferase (PAPS reductase)/FAD synthetase